MKPQRENAMIRHSIAVLACLLSLAACKDRHEPLKPTVAPPSFAILA